MTDDDGIHFCKVYDSDGGSILVVPEDADKVDALVSLYLDSACTRDTLIHLTRIDGGPYVTRASVITSWSLSTPVQRERAREIEAALNAEAAPWERGD